MKKMMLKAVSVAANNLLIWLLSDRRMMPSVKNIIISIEQY